MTRVRSFIAMSMLAGLVMAGAWRKCDAQDVKLYVGNSRGDDVSIIDMSTFKVVGDIKLGGDRIHGITIQPDGRRLFTTVESDHTLRIVDTATNQTVGSVKVGGRPNQCAVTPNGKYAVVPIRDGDSVDIVDVAQLKVVKTLPIKEPHNALNAGSNRYMWVSAMSGHEVNLIDLEKMDYAAHLPVDDRPRPYVVSTDGKTMYVAIANLHGFEIVDIPQKKVTQKVEIPAEHKGPAKARKYETPDTLTHGLAVTQDGRELWVTSLLDDCVYIYDLQAKKVTGRVDVGDGPNWMGFTPDGKNLAVSNTDSGDVSIISVKERKEVARVKVGGVPKRLVLATVPEYTANEKRRR